METQIVNESNGSQISPFDDFIPKDLNELTVHSMSDADFYLGKVADLDGQIQAINESAAIQIDRIQEWKETRTVSIERQKEYFLKVLHIYLLSTGKKTEKLVNGTLSIRKQQDEIVVEDKNVVIQDGRFIREKITISVNITGIRKHIENTGEIPEGITVNSREPKFSYKINP